MAKEQLSRVKAGNGIERSVPKFDGNIRRGSGRKNEGMPVDRNPRSVSDKRGAVGGIEIRNVMRRMTRSVKHPKLAGSLSESLSSVKDRKIRRRNRQKVAEQTLQAVSIEPRSTAQKLSWVDHVLRAARMDIDFQARILADERSGRGGMVQMNMSQQDGVEIGNAHTFSLKLLAKRIQS